MVCRFSLFGYNFDFVFGYDLELAISVFVNIIRETIFWIYGILVGRFYSFFAFVWCVNVFLDGDPFVNGTWYKIVVAMQDFVDAFREERNTDRCVCWLLSVCFLYRRLDVDADLKFSFVDASYCVIQHVVEVTNVAAFFVIEDDVF